jgi:hypothetical protein
MPATLILVTATIAAAVLSVLAPYLAPDALVAYTGPVS